MLVLSPWKDFFLKMIIIVCYSTLPLLLGSILISLMRYYTVFCWPRQNSLYCVGSLTPPVTREEHAIILLKRGEGITNNRQARRQKQTLLVYSLQLDGVCSGPLKPFLMAGRASDTLGTHSITPTVVFLIGSHERRGREGKRKVIHIKCNVPL